MPEVLTDEQLDQWDHDGAVCPVDLLTAKRQRTTRGGSRL